LYRNQDDIIVMAGVPRHSNFLPVTRKAAAHNGISIGRRNSSVRASIYVLGLLPRWARLRSASNAAILSASNPPANCTKQKSTI
jgi:hypothetical protein